MDREKAEREREREMVRSREKKIVFVSLENISFIYKDVTIVGSSQIVDLTR